MLLNEFKQEVLRINNKVNQDICDQGLLSQRVDVIKDKILITAVNRRLSALRVASAVDPDTVNKMDRILTEEFKSSFLDEIEQSLGVRPLTHLKDYDPQLEVSVSVTIFDRPVEQIIKGVEWPKNK